MKRALILMCFFLISGCGDNHSPQPSPTPTCEFIYSEWSECQADSTQLRTVISQQPEGCKGDPDILTQECEYIPPIVEPTDCCPDQPGTLKCGSCTYEKPCESEYTDVSIYCTGDLYAEPYWYMKIGWGLTWIDIDPWDTSCCPVEDTGICPDQCTTTEKCAALYSGMPTEWYIYSQYGYWYVFSTRFYQSGRIFINE